MDDPDQVWIQVYFHIFKSYIDPSVSLENLEDLEFCIPNLEKTSKEKSSFVLPPNIQSENPNDIAEIIMVHWK